MRNNKVKMQKGRRINSLPALVCCMALALFSGCSAEGEVSTGSAESGAGGGAASTVSEGGITVTLATDKQSYRAGEEINYTFTIENANLLSIVKGAEFSYSGTEGLKAAREGSAPAAFEDIQPGETCTISGTLVRDETGESGMAAPIQAADASTVKLRPYLKFEYDGQEVMIRAVMEFNLQQKRWVVGEADRKQNKRITCHDPSIFKDFDGTYYVLGTHITGGSSKDLIDWVSLDSDIQAGYSQETRDQVKAWNDDDKAGSWLGYLWAPDIVYNTAMQKYCVYLSANGDYWKSNIVLLTADSVTGPYEYAGSIVYGGFTADDFGETDAPMVLGTDEIPQRYVTNGIANKKWGDMWPNCIDPCVFYDDDGNLWMSYGSWSGGIFLLKLDAETGLRDYSVSYETDIHSDAYFGRKIAGGAYVSGEASYIQKIGGYYYLFISYGNLEAAGGYNVRVFRSERPDGDYVDALGNSPLYDSYVFNYNQSVGVRLMGGYKWRNFNFGQVAQGHNSAFVDDDGRAYIVYHTRTTDGSEGHYVKVHQLFQTKEGWLVAAPYRTTGEALKNGGYSVQEAAGAYEIILHELDIDYKNKEVKSPRLINLNEDGTITGDYTGVWKLEPGTSYISLQFNGVSYSGVALEMTVENTVFNTMVFTALGDDQVTLWGSRVVEQQ